jgi:thioredoxin-like negative regulator of GroEL
MLRVSLMALLVTLVLLPRVATTATDSDDDSDGSKSWEESRDDVIKLTPAIFTGNVKRTEGPGAEHWIVLFCTGWLPDCNKFGPEFAHLSGEYQEKHNTDLMSPTLRFARVDCAANKPLCNTQGVDWYPTVVHYRQGQALATWTEGKRFEKWLEKRLSRKTSEAWEAARVKARKAEETPARKEVVSKLRTTFLGIVVVLAVGSWVAAASMEPASARVFTGTAARAADHATERASAERYMKPDEAKLESTLDRCLPNEWYSEPPAATSMML